MTGSLRLSALLLLLLSRWAYADLEKGEDEFVRSWVIIEEQLVPPSRDELLQIGNVGGGGVAVGGVANRRITPKSVFVAPSFNKCSDGYRPDNMGRCVKVVKINQAAQWDFLLKQLNSMYGPGGNGAFPVPSGQYRPAAATMTTTTTELPVQKTDSPGPFQLNIPLVMEPVSPVNSQMSTSTEDDGENTTGGISSTTTIVPINATTVATAATTTDNDSEVTDNDGDSSTVNSETTSTVTITSDYDDAAVTATEVTTDTSTAVTGRPRPYDNPVFHQTEPQNPVVGFTNNESSTYSTTSTTDHKTKYVESSSSSRTTSVETDYTSKPVKAMVNNTVPPITSSMVTTTPVSVTETEELAETSKATTAETEGDDEENVVTVLAVAAVDGGKPSFTRLSVNDERTQPQFVDTVTPEYYDDQPEQPTPIPEPLPPDCSSQDAYRYYVACTGFRQQQQQQLHQQQQQQLLIQQQLYQQQQQQQQHQPFYGQQQYQQPVQHAASALVKRPAAMGGGVQIRFPEEEDPAAGDHVNLIRFPGPAPYRTTNKMFESSRHPTWWPTGWPEQQQNPGDSVQQQQQQQQHRVHQSQQKQDVRYWEFGSRLPKTSVGTTTAAPPPPPPPPSTQWFRRYF